MGLLSHVADSRPSVAGADTGSSRSDAEPPAIVPTTSNAMARSRTITMMTGRAQSPEIVSVGYEQRSLEDLIGLLTRNNVEVLIDVRLNPISRKKGFSKTALSDALGAAGIEYRHERSLGNLKENRDPFRKGLKSARDRYLRHLRDGAATVYDEVVALAGTARVALLCYEREHRQCHRSCILDTAQSDQPGLMVLQL